MVWYPFIQTFCNQPPADVTMSWYKWQVGLEAGPQNSPVSYFNLAVEFRTCLQFKNWNDSIFNQERRKKILSLSRSNFLNSENHISHTAAYFYSLKIILPMSLPHQMRYQKITFPCFSHQVHFPPLAFKFFNLTQIFTTSKTSHSFSTNKRYCYLLHPGLVY